MNAINLVSTISAILSLFNLTWTQAVGLDIGFDCLGPVLYLIDRLIRDKGPLPIYDWVMSVKK